MSGFIDRLERELVEAANRRPKPRRAGPARARAARTWQDVTGLGHGAGMTASVAIVFLIVAVVILTGQHRPADRAAASPGNGPPGSSVTSAPRPSPGGSIAHACAFHSVRGQTVWPRPAFSVEPPDRGLRSVLGTRTRSDKATIGPVLHWLAGSPWPVLTAYTRYIRMLTASDGLQVALLPARACASMPAGPGSGSLIPRDEVLALVGTPGRWSVHVLGTPALVRSFLGGQLGLEVLAVNRRFVAILIVPKQVARVVCHFADSAPSTVVAAVHDGVALVTDHVPPAGGGRCSWYAADGQVLKRFGAA